MTDDDFLILLPCFYNQPGSAFVLHAKIKKVQDKGKRINDEVIKWQINKEYFACSQHQNRVFH